MKNVLPISLVVITLNEEHNLRRCLEAANFCSEYVVVDSGSTDKTIQIARQFGARVIHRNWTGYRDQKNFGTEQATQPWVLCIDADEVVSVELRTDIFRQFERDPDFDAFAMNRHSYYGKRLINHSGWYPQWRFFLYRKGKASWTGDEPHTVVSLHGARTARLHGDLYHFTYANLRQHLHKNLAAARDAALAMHNSGRRGGLGSLLLRAPWAVFRTYVLQRGFLDGFYGLMIAVVNGFYTFAKYAMLYELNHDVSNRSEHASDK